MDNKPDNFENAVRFGCGGIFGVISVLLLLFRLSEFDLSKNVLILENLRNFLL